MKRNRQPDHSHVKILLGDPERAIVRFSLPMIVAYLVQALYNFVDGIWVAGLGAEALSAIGLFFPPFMIIVSLASGIGMGGNSIVSRMIGARKRKTAEKASGATLVLTILVSILTTMVALPNSRNIFLWMGANPTVASLGEQYASVMFGGVIFFFLSNVLYGLLRGEGDFTRAMRVMVLGSVLNMVLDPLFIYTLGMGIRGAALASVLSMAVVCGVLSYRVFVRKNTFVSPRLALSSLEKPIVLDILRVGLPSSIAHMSMSVSVFFLNMITISVAGTMGVAVFTSAWRAVMVGFVPVMAIAMSVTTVIGAAYGEKNIQKMKKGYYYSLRLGVLVETIALLVLVASSGLLARIFMRAESAEALVDTTRTIIIIVSLFLPVVPLGVFSAAMFRGMGWGERSMTINILRTLVFQVGLAYAFTRILGMGLVGVAIGTVLGNILGALVGFAWGVYTLKSLEEKLGNSESKK